MTRSWTRPPGTPRSASAAGTATSATPKCPPAGPAAATSSAPACIAPSATAGCSGTTIRTHTYYRCPHDPGLPRHYAAYPGHRTVTVPETVMMDALTRFFTERVFGPDRAAMLAAHIPATAAAAEQRRRTQAGTLRRKLAKIDTAEAALITELETPADPADPAAQALRQRIRARFTELYGQRTTLETELAALDAAAPAGQDDDPTLLDELPNLGDILTGAPPALTERLLDAFDVQAVYNRDKHQVTIHATITDATPQALRDLLADPRADHNTPPASDPGTAPQDPVSHLTGDTGSSPRASTAQRGVPGGRPPGLAQRSGGFRGVVPPGLMRGVA